ncbi:MULTISPECIES: hypothetical protein [unclassified Streptomyces]|uniref:hypothetical protein n=1 Tax=unclassified Streptomyces TaxID=2593676 RepID=UPI00382E27B2
MKNHISTLTSALGVAAGLLLLYIAITEYRAGASIAWIPLAGFVLLSAGVALIRDTFLLARKRRSVRGDVKR